MGVYQIRGTVLGVPISKDYSILLGAILVLFCFGIPFILLLMNLPWFLPDFNWVSSRLGVQDKYLAHPKP